MKEIEQVPRENFADAFDREEIVGGGRRFKRVERPEFLNNLFGCLNADA